MSPSDIYVRSFPYLSYTNKISLHKKLWVVYPCFRPLIEILSSRVPKSQHSTQTFRTIIFQDDHAFLHSSLISTLHFHFWYITLLFYSTVQSSLQCLILLIKERVEALKIPILRVSSVKSQRNIKAQMYFIKLGSTKIR